jgi:hypothetical protein
MELFAVFFPVVVAGSFGKECFPAKFGHLGFTNCNGMGSGILSKQVHI